MTEQTVDVKDIITEQFDRLINLRGKDKSLKDYKHRFHKYPNRYFINDETDALTFFKDILYSHNKRDKLSLFLSYSKLLSKLVTESLELSLPSGIFPNDEPIIALKLINDAIICWTDNYVYKIPTAPKAYERIVATRNKLDLINSLNENIADKFHQVEIVVEEELLFEYNQRCHQFTWDNLKVNELDQFLDDYFQAVVSTSTSSEKLPTGLQHGDLHYLNIFIDQQNNYKITDIDLLKTDGYPFLDLMHFAIHLIRNKKRAKQHEPLIKFLEDKSYIPFQLKKLGFEKMTEFWMKNFNDKYIDLYIDSRIQWYHNNKIIGDELDQLEEIRQQL